MIDGWIKIHRQIKEWQHYQEPNVLLVWLDLLTSANTKDGWWHGRKIRRGELFTSIESIHQNTGLDVKTIRKALATLEASGEIKREATNAGSKIIINQFNKFQSWGNDTQPLPQHIPQPLPQQDTQPLPQRLPYKQEYKEVKNERIKENLSTHTHHAREDFKILGIFQNVKLTDSDLERIRVNFATEGLGQDFVDRCVDKLSAYMAQNGTHYTNHAAAILSWVKAAVLEEDIKTGKAKPKPAAMSSKTETNEEFIIRVAWEAMTAKEKQDYLDTHNGQTLIQTKGQP